MTYFLNFRAGGVGGPVVDPYLLSGDGTVNPATLTVVDWAQVPSILAGKNILFVAHGFNVSYQAGATTLGLLERYLALQPPSLFVGVLWPGDCWIPLVDYPFEGDVAMDCGRRLGAFCNSWCARAQSLFFVSHSLGVRVVLEAMAHLDRPGVRACLTAGAINRDCLEAEYADVLSRTTSISGLSSRSDDVLKIAFTIGDPFADLLHDDHTPFQPALGYGGPATPAPSAVAWPWQISDGDDYGHGDYLPASGKAKWQRVADFIKCAYLRQAQTWPS